MSVLEVQDPGMQTTVQDLGRPGFGHLGVSACGAADPLALRIGNRLLGNPDHAAALEMTLRGGRFLFRGAAWFALTGAEFGATLDGLAVPLWNALPASAGQSLALGGARLGARCYLCLRGGLDVPAVLDSRSTHLPSRIGGLDGRALRKGDALPIGGAAADFTPRRIRPEAIANLRFAGDVLRLTEAAQTAQFPAASRARLLSDPWTVQTDSSRMGVRLSGAPLAGPMGGSMITEGAPLGAIQVTPAGQPVILGVDHQTTGGYPKIGCVISADRWRIGQLRPRQNVRFELVSFEHACRVLIEQEESLRPEVSGL
ncbi:MAG: biotin-dependent carboxyltransferase family protein [Bryobacteraceae bacterium]